MNDGNRSEMIRCDGRIEIIEYDSKGDVIGRTYANDPEWSVSESEGNQTGWLAEPTRGDPDDQPTGDRKTNK